MFQKIFKKCRKSYYTLELNKAYDLNDLAWGKSALQKGADVNAADQETGETLLIHAVGQQNEAFARLLLSFGADVNAADRQGRTALHNAARGDSEALLNLLIAHRARSQKNVFGNYPLDVAAMIDNEKATAILMKTVDEKALKTAWQHAVASKAQKTPHILLSEYFMREIGNDYDKMLDDKQTYLTAAVEGNEVVFVKRLIEAGASVHFVDGNRETALDVAKRVHSPLVDYLTQVYEKEESIARKVLKSYGVNQDITLNSPVVSTQNKRLNQRFSQTNERE